MNSLGKIRIGSRGSNLAIAQAKIVEDLLIKKGFQTEIIKIKSKGDYFDIPLRFSNGFGIFTKELDKALLNNEIDMAVHSMKDYPTTIEKGLKISAVLKRGPVEDFLVSKFSFFSLPEGAKIGTSSQRRRDFIKFLRPDLEVVDLRGNLDTRIRKYNNGEYDGIVVAKVGLERLGINIVGETLDKDIFVPQPNQGAIAVITRDDEFFKIASSIDDIISHLETMVEREALKVVNAGCHSSIGIISVYQNDHMRFHASLIKNGKRMDFYRLFSLDKLDLLLNDFKRWYNE